MNTRSSLPASSLLLLGLMVFSCHVGLSRSQTISFQKSRPRDLSSFPEIRGMRNYAKYGVDKGCMAQFWHEYGHMALTVWHGWRSMARACG